MYDLTTIKIYGIGEIPAAGASEILNRINYAYGGLWILDRMCDMDNYELQDAFKEFEDSFSYSVLTNGVYDSSECLELKGVVLQSPGFWEFLGTINPLETIRIYLNDRHERKKDSDYRNSLERQRLSIENNLLKLKLVDRFVASSRNAGIPEESIRRMLRDKALLPMLGLEEIQDKGGITYAEMPETETET